jgi:hypothetical protein
MKIIDTQPKVEPKKVGPVGRIIGSLRDRATRPDTSALTILIDNLGKVLDDRYILLKNVELRGLRIPIPSILVGPTGIRVFYPSDAAGIFRANERIWEQLTGKGQNYKAVRPNPLALAVAMAGSVENQLSNARVDFPKIDAVIFFAQPAIHIDSSRPVAKIVLPDMLDRFLAGLIQGQVLLDREGIRRITSILSGREVHSLDGPLQEVRDEFSFQDKLPPKPARHSPLSNLPKDEPAMSRKVPFTRVQWFLVALLILINIAILTTLVIYISGSVLR